MTWRITSRVPHLRDKIVHWRGKDAAFVEFLHEVIASMPPKERRAMHDYYIKGKPTTNRMSQYLQRGRVALITVYHREHANGGK